VLLIGVVRARREGARDEQFVRRRRTEKKMDLLVNYCDKNC